MNAFIISAFGLALLGISSAYADGVGAHVDVLGVGVGAHVGGDGVGAGAHVGPVGAGAGVGENGIGTGAHVGSASAGIGIHGRHCDSWGRRNDELTGVARQARRGGESCAQAMPWRTCEAR